jgi:hypothetical protein
MQNKLLRKSFALGIVVLFIGAVVVPSISSYSFNVKQNLSKKEMLSFNPFEEGWRYRKKVTINHNKVDGNLINFPVLVSTVDSDLRDKAQIDGDDILFMDDKGEANQLYHEIEYYDETSGNLVAWVNIPSLSSSVDSFFYMYYGNLNCASQEYPEKVWDDDYIHVWHLGESLIDSAGSDDGNDHGTDIVTGKIGEGRDFESNEGDYIDCGYMAQPGDGSLITMTWEGWVKSESIDSVLMCKYDSQGPDYASYYIGFRNGGKFRLGAYKDWNVNSYGETYSFYSEIGQWVYLTAVFNLGGINELYTFVDGDEVSFKQESYNADYLWNIPITDDIGRYRREAGTMYADAVMDEFRWSKVIRSDEWIKTSFNTMDDPSSFITFGKEEEKSRSRNTFVNINDGLVGYWSFDFENAEDESGNENHGIIDEAIIADGLSGKALILDGEDDHVEIIDTSDFEFANQDLTFSVWVKIADNENHYRHFVSLGDATDDVPRIDLAKARSEAAQGRIFGQIYTPDESQVLSFDEGDEIPKNEWLFLTIVADYPGSFKLYLNAELQDLDDLVGFDMSDAESLELWIGGCPWEGISGHGFHNSFIDEVRIYERALTENEIDSLYTNPASLKDTIIIGRISNLNTDVGNLNTFEAISLFCIQFSPFKFIRYKSGELIKISESYRGLLNNNLAIGIFQANI